MGGRARSAPRRPSGSHRGPRSWPAPRPPGPPGRSRLRGRRAAERPARPPSRSHRRRHLGIGRGLHQAVGERVVAVGVVSGGDRDQVRAERRAAIGATTCWTSDRNSSSPGPAAPAGSPCTPPPPPPRVVRRAGARIERPLVDARVQHAVGPAKIASVPLPWWTSQSRISTRSAPHAASACGGGDRDVVEQAEAHRAGRPRRGGPAVAGRRRRSDRRRPAAARRHAPRPAGGVKRRFVGALARHRVDVDHAAAARADRLDRVDVLVG